jgi:stage IV sporulation protein FB
MRLGQLEVSRGALLALALLYYLDDSGVMVRVLMASLLHELGHWGAIRAMGGGVTCLRLSCSGAELRLSAAHPLSHRQMFLAALAGPCVNLLLAWGSAVLARHGMGETLYFFAGLNLGLATFNLLPAGWLDGGKAIQHLWALFGREETGISIVRGGSLLVTILLLSAGGILLCQSGGKNFTLLIAGLWMTAAGSERKKSM